MKTHFYLILLLSLWTVSIMPIGTPDFNQNLATNPTAPSYDTGEDTTRILMGGGSLARSGRWVFATGFEEGKFPFLNVSASTGLGYAGSYATTTYQGIGCLQLRPEATSGQFAVMTKGFTYPASNYGIEFQISTQGTNPETEIMLYGLGYGDSKTLTRFARILLISTSLTEADLYVYTAPAVKTLIAHVSFGSTFRLFKVVYDIKNNNIKRIYIGSNYFELNTPGYEVSGSASISESIYIQLKTTNKNTTENQYILIDNMIFTADEP